jgi:hypothetical protein
MTGTNRLRLPEVAKVPPPPPFWQACMNGLWEPMAPGDHVQPFALLHRTNNLQREFTIGNPLK